MAVSANVPLTGTTGPAPRASAPGELISEEDATTRAARPEASDPGIARR
ncbi:hypothetical protein [Saccharopolyspora shandongensis]